MEYEAGPKGYIFGCNRDTIDECLHRCLFGLPENYREDVEAIAAGTPLFLFHYNTRELWGGFVAKQPGGFEIVKGAFGGRFPSQVRVKRTTVAQDCIPESEFKRVLQDNYFQSRKFQFCLSTWQVLQLTVMFNTRPASRSEAPSEKRLKRCKESQPSQAPVVATHPISQQELRELFDLTQCCEAIDKSMLESGKDKRTTICVGPLPGEGVLSAGKVVKFLNTRYCGKYDFLLVRYFDKVRLCFVNFVHPREVLSIINHLHNREWSTVLDGVPSGGKKIKVGFWRLQGIPALAKKFRGEGFWHSGGAQSCKELYDDRAVFFYGAGAMIADRRIVLPPSSSHCKKEDGVRPLTAFLNGWPSLTDASFLDLKVRTENGGTNHQQGLL